MTRLVLGLDLSKVGLGQALEAMAEAWLEAQGVEACGNDPLPMPPERDPWFNRLDAWSGGHFASGADGSVSPTDKFTTNEALISAGLETGKAAEMRAARILEAIGYVKEQKQRRAANGRPSRVRVWSRPA